MSGPVRLLWLIDSLHVGGAESLASVFARRHDSAKFDLTICYLRGTNGSALEEEVRRSGVPAIALDAKNLRDRAAFRRLTHCIRERGIELIHAHLTYSSIWGALASRVTGVPLVASLHVTPTLGRTRFGGLRDRLLRFTLDRWATLVVMVSDALRREYLEAGGIRASKLCVVHNGIEVERFEGERGASRARLTAEFGVPAAAPVIAAVSVLRREKGIDVLLRAVAALRLRFPQVRLLVVGDGEMRDEWRQLADDLGIGEAVSFAGLRADVNELLPGCDVFALPTFADALPTVVMEAMAAALPVVASRVGGIPEMIEDGVTGILVPPRDERALADALARLLGDEGLLKKMASAARDAALRRFSTQAWMARLEEVYRTALGARMNDEGSEANDERAAS